MAGTEGAGTPNLSGNKSLWQGVWEENIAFWTKAWAPLKTPYKQMPDLPYLTSIAERLKGENAVTVLDLGCGSGWLSVYLANCQSELEISGIDLAPQAIKLAEQWASEDGLSIKFRVGDVAALPYEEGRFDAVVANSIFEHLTLELAQAALLEAKRVLKPGGVFFGCFDKVGTGPGEYYKLDDGTHVYTDKGRAGMLLRCFSDEELKELFAMWQIISFETIESGSRLIWARA
jgi:SAM-dependent methyltransferase